MGENIQDWSTTALSNESSDSSINWSEGQMPGTVNGSARSMMATIAKWRDDRNGSLTTGGSANAYTLTTNTAYAALETGLTIAFKASFSNTGSCTLNLTPSGGAAFGAKSIKVIGLSGEANPAANAIRQNGHYTVSYDAAANGAAGAWVMRNFSLGTAATENTGTSGTAVPLLDANNTFSGATSFSAAGVAPLVYDTSAYAIGNGGKLKFDAKNAASAQVTFAQAGAQSTTMTAGAEVGDFVVSTMRAGTLTESLRILGAGNALVGTRGLVGAPALAFNADTDTGLWSPAADTLAWSVGGAELMRLSSTGLGVGVTAAAKFHVSGTSQIDLGASSTLKIYGADRGDGYKYLTMFNSNIPGILTNGYITINGASGDPVPNTIAGNAGNFMLGIQSDAGAGPVVVIKGETGSIFKIYDTTDQLTFEMFYNGGFSSIGDIATTSTTASTSTTTGAIKSGGGLGVVGAAYIGGGIVDGVFQVSSAGWCAINATVVSGRPLNLGFNGGADIGIAINDTNSTSGGTQISFRSGGATVGGITTTTSATTYATSSDKRLKEDGRKFTSSGDIIDALEIWDFRWKRDGTRALGVFAQDAYDVWPDAIVVGKDNEPWQADYSKYVPLLLVELQSVRRRLAALEKHINSISKPEEM